MTVPSIGDGLRLLPFLERRGLALVEILEPLLDDAREIELRARLVRGGQCRDELVLRLHHFGTVELEHT